MKIKLKTKKITKDDQGLWAYGRVIRWDGQFSFGVTKSLKYFVEEDISIEMLKDQQLGMGP